MTYTNWNENLIANTCNFTCIMMMSYANYGNFISIKFYIKSSINLNYPFMYNLPSCINFKLYHLLSLCIIDEIDKVFF